MAETGVAFNPRTMADITLAGTVPVCARKPRGKPDRKRVGIPELHRAERTQQDTAADLNTFHSHKRIGESLLFFSALAALRSDTKEGTVFILRARANNQRIYTRTRTHRP